MNSVFNNNKLLSLFFVALSFTLFLSVTHPIINSDDDFYFLYTVSGAYGVAPSSILHYIYTWNPIVTWPIKKLFILFPKFNWYSLALLSMQFVSNYFLLAIIIKYSKNIVLALVTYSLFFLFIESNLLLSLNYSNASIALALAGSVMIGDLYLHNCINNKNDIRKFILPSLFVLIASMVRFHTTILVFFLTFVSILSLTKPFKYKNIIGTFTIIGLMVMIVVLSQIFYYNKVIPNWSNEENLRQALFFNANNPLRAIPNANNNEILSTKENFIKKWLLFDSSFISTSDINNYNRKYYANRISNWKDNKPTFYWLFINSRVYILLIASLFLMVIILNNKHFFYRGLITCFGYTILFLYLLCFHKITQSIEMIFLSCILFYFIFDFNGKVNKNNMLLASLVLLFIALYLNFKFLYIENKSNVTAIEKTNCQLNTFIKNPTFLFVDVDDIFDDSGFDIFKIPVNFKLTNLINRQTTITNFNKTILKKFGISQILDEATQNKKIIFLAKDIINLKNYYKTILHLNVDFVKLNLNDCLSAYNITLQK